MERSGTEIEQKHAYFYDEVKTYKKIGGNGLR